MCGTTGWGVTATWIIAARHFGQSAEWAKAFINRRPAKPGSLRADAKQVVFTPRRRDPAALGAGPAAADYDFSAEAANGGGLLYLFLLRVSAAIFCAIPIAGFVRGAVGLRLEGFTGFVLGLGRGG